MALKVLINCSPVSQGGALQVTQSILTEAMRDNRIEYRIIGSRQVREALAKANVTPGHYHVLTSESAFKRYSEASSVLQQYEKDFQPEICYSVYGPTTWKPSKTHFVGFAYGHFIYPELDPYRQLHLVPRMILKAKDVLRKRYVSNADYWFVQTNTVGDRLAKTFNLPRERMLVASNTYSTSFKARLATLNTPRPSDQYCRILVPAAYYPHKNLEIVPRMIPHLLKENLPKRPRFQFTVPKEHSGWQNILKIARENNVPEDTYETLGNIPNATFADAYHQADLVFLPTLLECSTAVYPEAFVSERAVATTNRDFARELCGNAVLYFDPFSPEDAARQVKSLMTDPALVQSLIEKGRTQLTTAYSTPAQRWQGIFNNLSTLRR